MKIFIPLTKELNYMENKENNENDMRCSLINVKQMVEIVPNTNNVGVSYYLDGMFHMSVNYKMTNNDVICLKNSINSAYSRGFSKASEFIMNKKRGQDREVIIQAFLSGKKFSDGDQFAPNASLDIANKWYDDNFK